MHWSNKAKAIILMVNHVLATHVPAASLLGQGIYGHDESMNGISARDTKFNSFWTPCNCLDRCPVGKIFDVNDCKKCQDCPKNEKPDKEQKKCVEDKKRKRFNEKVKQKKIEYKPRGFEKWKKIRTKEYKDKVDEEKRRKVRRMVRHVSAPYSDRLLTTVGSLSCACSSGNGSCCSWRTQGHLRWGLDREHGIARVLARKPRRWWLV